MAIRYKKASDMKNLACEIVEKLGWDHILLEHVDFIKSFGSKSRRTIARCHALGKAMQLGMNRTKGFYVIELISKRFDKLSEQDKIKTIIHELMHIPRSFGGGFKHHNVVTEKNVGGIYEKFVGLKKREEGF